MRSQPRKSTTIEVTPLDLTATQERALTFIRENTQPEATEATTRTLGIVDTPAGLYVLCTEGVGTERPVTDDEPLVIDFGYRISNGGSGGSFSMGAVATSTMTPDEIRECATGEPVNLAEFIRTFGSRLDQNYNLWLGVLAKAQEAAA